MTLTTNQPLPSAFGDMFEEFSEFFTFPEPGDPLRSSDSISRFTGDAPDEGSADPDEALDRMLGPLIRPSGLGDGMVTVDGTLEEGLQKHSGLAPIYVDPDDPGQTGYDIPIVPRGGEDFLNLGGFGRTGRSSGFDFSPDGGGLSQGIFRPSGGVRRRATQGVSVRRESQVRLESPDE